METAEKTIASGDNAGAVSMSPPAPCSPVWVRVGEYEVCTYVDAKHQQRCAEMQLRGWERLGRPKCTSVRPANAAMTGAESVPSNGVVGESE
jgi:hypothetical protein